MNIKVISLGYHCQVAINLRDSEITPMAYPFSWIQVYDVPTIKLLLYNEFKNLFTDKSKFIINDSASSESDKNYIHKDLNVYVPHDFEPDMSNFEDVIEKYDRRMKRLYDDCEKPNSIIFIRWLAPKEVITNELKNDYSHLVEYMKVKFDNPNIKLLIITKNHFEQFNRNVLLVKDDFKVHQFDHYLPLLNSNLRIIPHCFKH
jgi:hypothetical protein